MSVEQLREENRTLRMELEECRRIAGDARDDVNFLVGWADDELEAKNRQLEEKNRELSAKARELEEVMAMFAHEFRGPVDSIIFNAEHELHSPLLANIGRTMNGLLEIFSYVSVDSEILRSRLANDSVGPATFGQVVRKSLWLALVQLLSPRRVEVMAYHYFAYAKRTGRITTEVNFKSWREEDEFIEVQKSLGSIWEIEVGCAAHMETSNAILDWCREHLFNVTLSGIDEMAIRFKAFGPKESVLLIFLTELFVNAIKHFDCDSADGLSVACHVNSGVFELSFCNPSNVSSRNRGRGSGRGHKFLRLIAGKLGGEFVPPDYSGNSVAVLRIPSRLFHCNNVQPE
jgi:hypothetical protein